MRAVAELGASRMARSAGRGLPVLSVAMALAVATLALGYVVYVLWPRWPDMPVAMDAPALPIVIADVVFQVPPAAIRRKVQRRPGAQERIDLVYVWPALTPAAATNDPETAPPAAGRIFVNIAAAAGALAPAERLRLIYPRYAEQSPTAGPNGLAAVAFRDGTPYQGEDLLFDPVAPDRFLVRCTREGKGSTPGTCLYERFVGKAAMTVRFRRDLLDGWRALASGVDRLIERLRPSGG